jgi:hypothetical protein
MALHCTVLYGTERTNTERGRKNTYCTIRSKYVKKAEWVVRSERVRSVVLIWQSQNKPNQGSARQALTGQDKARQYRVRVSLGIAWNGMAEHAMRIDRMNLLEWVIGI